MIIPELSFPSYLSLQLYNKAEDMLGNDSQFLAEEDNDNEFLPNHSNSYESMIKEHTERRSLILNDQLVLPSNHSEDNSQPFIPSHSIEDGGGLLRGESQPEQSHSSEGDIEQNEENEFLINENSLAASIKHALNAEESKLQSSMSEHKLFPPSNDSAIGHFESNSNRQEQYSSLEKSAKDNLLASDPLEAEGSVSLARNSESKSPSQPSKEEEMLGENSASSDPFENAAKDQFSSNSYNHFEQQSKNNVLPESNEQDMNPSSQSQEMMKSKEEGLMQASYSKHSQDESFSRSKHKSRSQIQGLYSDLQPQSDVQKQSSSQVIQQESQKSQHDENSLSNLMRYDYFGKEYNHSIQQIQSEPPQGSENYLESDVEIFKKDPMSSELKFKQDSFHANFQEQSKEQCQPEVHEQIEEADPFQSNLNELPRDSSKSIIDNYNSSNSQDGHEEVEEEVPQFHNMQKSSNFNQIPSRYDNPHEESDSGLKSQLANSIQSHSSKSEFHEASNFNQFNGEPNHKEQVSLQALSQPNSNLLSQNLQENLSSEFIPPQNEPSLQPSRSNMSESSQLSQKSHPRSPKVHQKQKSSVDRSSKHSSNFHLPEIDNKSRKSDVNSSKQSHLSKNAPSLRVDNESRLSQHSSKHPTHKKNNSKLETIRDKVASYSQGIDLNEDKISQNFQEAPLGSTTVDSKSTILKKKSSGKEIFNTYPQTMHLMSSGLSDDVSSSEQKLAMQPILENNPREKQISMRSPAKEREDQLQRIRVLKEAQKKRLERELQKVKKELEEINSREKNMDRIYEQKQKIEVKERENLVASREKEHSTKLHRHNRENEAIMKIIKDHRRSKDDEDLKGVDLEENITKNLMDLSLIRREAEQKLREKKKLDIIDRMKRNEMRKLNEQKLIKANNQYIQQFRSADLPVQSPPAKPANDKPHPKKILPKDIIANPKLSKLASNERKRPSNGYQQKLD